MTRVTQISRTDARRFLLARLGLLRFQKERGPLGIRALIESLRCIQLDPLAPIGTNADLVALARVPGAKLGDVYRSLFPGHAFEHFAKERCILPARSFPYYQRASQESAGTHTPWWRQNERLERISPETIGRVLAEIRERGPLHPDQLSDQGKVDPLDWSGWKGTSSASKMALEILWAQCEIVVAARDARDKHYDVPERALGEAVAATPTMEFGEFAFLERIEATGFLRTSSGPQWSMLAPVRKAGLPRALVEAGRVALVAIEGSSRQYFAAPDFLDRPLPRMDDHLRILGPLDPLLWDRELVRHVFDFDYVWEVYKPAPKRRWGWYVCPLLHRGELVGRIEARIVDDVFTVQRKWREAAKVDDTAFRKAIERHARASRCRDLRLGRRWERNPA